MSPQRYSLASTPITLCDINVRSYMIYDKRGGKRDEYLVNKSYECADKTVGCIRGQLLVI